MGPIGIVILVIMVISAILLVLFVLIQDEEGEGIGGLFSGGSSTPFGSRAGNVLTRFTAILAAIFLFCSFALAWVNRSPEAGNVISKARQESLQSNGASANWWVETGAPPKEQPKSQQDSPSTQPAAPGGE